MNQTEKTDSALSGASCMPIKSAAVPKSTVYTDEEQVSTLINTVPEVIVENAADTRTSFFQFRARTVDRTLGDSILGSQIIDKRGSKELGRSVILDN